MCVFGGGGVINEESCNFREMFNTMDLVSSSFYKAHPEPHPKQSGVSSVSCGQTEACREGGRRRGWLEFWLLTLSMPSPRHHLARLSLSLHTFSP